MALVQRSWCYPAQVELFRAVILKCPLRAQLFVEAFVRNLGPGNPAIRRGVNRLPLERYVRYIYVDVPENYSQTDFYNSLGSFLPLLTNLQSLYIVMRRWDVYIWDIQLGKHLPEHAPPSLQRLCIQVSGHINTMIYYLSLQLRFPQVIQPPGRSRTGQTSIGGGHGLRSGNIFGQSPSSAKTYAGGDRLTQQHPRHARRRKKMYASGWLTLHWIVLRYGLAPVESSFSSQLRVACAQFHNFYKTELPRHRYCFKRDKTTGIWMLSRSTGLTCSTVFEFCEDVCVESGCGICQMIEEERDLESLMSRLDGVRNVGWCHRMRARRPWSRLDVGRIYSLAV